MTHRERMAMVLVILAVVIVHTPLTDPLVLILVLSIGAVAMWAIYSRRQS